MNRPRVLEYLKLETRENLDNPAYSFGNLMDDISSAFTMQKFNTGEYTMPRSNNEIIKNMRVSVAVTRSALKAQYKDRIETDSSITRSGSITISLNGEMHGLNVTGGGSLSVAYSFNGPTSGSKLYDGSVATHNYKCGVLYAAINKTSWDVYDRFTDKYLYSDVIYTVDSNTADAVSFTTRAYINSDGELYIDCADPKFRTTRFWDSHGAFTSSILTDPLAYLEG